MRFTKNLQDILKLGTSNIISSATYGLFWLYLASILAVTEYGKLGFLMSSATVGSEISLLGSRSTVLVYESKNENVFPSSFVLVLISSGIAAVVSYVLIQNVMASLLMIGMTIFAITTSGLNGKQQYGKFSKHLLLRAAITVIFAIILQHFFGVNGILLGYFLATLFVLGELYVLMKNKKIEFSLLRSKIKFMLHTYGIALSEVFFWWGDKLLIGALFGFAILGNYHIAAQYLLLLSTIPRAISQYLVPQESIGKKNKKIKIFSMMVAILIAIISTIAIPLVVNTFLPNWAESIVAMQIMSIALVPYSISVIQQSEFLGKETPNIILIGAILQSGFYFLLIILLGPTLGLLGLAIGFLASTIVRAVFNLIAGLYVSKQK